MKVLPLFLILVLAAAAPAAETVPANSTPPALPSAGAKPDPALDIVPATPSQILPETSLTPENPESTGGGKPGASATQKRNKTEIAEQDLAERIHYRQARTKALADPAIQAEWAKSIAAHTDLERRESLIRYYKLLFARVKKIDPSLAKVVVLKQAYALFRLNQTHIAPTEARDASESSRLGFISPDAITADFF